MNTIDLTSPYIWIFFAGTAIHMCWNAWLSWRDKDYILKTAAATPNRIWKLHNYAKEMFSVEKLSKALEYERTISAFSAFENRISRFIAFGTLAFGLIPWLLNIAMTDFRLYAWLALAIIPILLSIANNVISLPFDYYSTFTLEERFGFNNSTVKLFFGDFFKNICIFSAIEFVISVGTFFAFYALFKMYGKLDLLACLCLSALSLLLMMLYELLYDKVLLPLFNEMKPLDECPLKSKMEDLLKKFGYNPSGVFVIDASKRSNHANAYCAGWGKNKHLVLFDTLLKDFSEDELMAILGHELAHSKLHHLVWNRVISFVGTFAYLYIATFFINDCCISMLNAFGFRDRILDNFAAYASSDVNMMLAAFATLGFMFFGKIWNSITWIFDGISSWISRKMEFAADAYSCKYTGNSDAMITALFKLYGKNLTYPVSDPIYEAWNFSHPSLINRVEALKSRSIDENNQ